MSPKVVITGTKTFRAAAIISNEAAVSTILYLTRLESSINPEAIATIPPIAAPALPSCPQSISPNFAATCANISIAAPIITRLFMADDMISGSTFFAKAEKPKAKPNIAVIAVPALPKSGHDIFPNLPVTSANISIAAPITTNVTNDSFMFALSTFFVKAEKPTAKPNITVIAVPALPKPSQLISEKSFAADANIFMAPAIATIARPMDIKL